MGSDARQWLDEFFHLVHLTHWILPYPSNVALITPTKTSRRQGLKWHMMWFSLVYAPPKDAATPNHWPMDQYPSLYNILSSAQQDTFGDTQDALEWDASQLIAACKAQGLQVHGQEEHWVTGKRSNGRLSDQARWRQQRKCQCLN